MAMKHSEGSSSGGSQKRPTAGFGFHIDIPAPYIDIPAPHGDIPAPHGNAVVGVDVPIHIDTPVPHVDAPPPHFDVPHFHFDIPTPHIDVPPPHFDVPHFHFDIPTPHVDIPSHDDIPQFIDITPTHVDLPFDDEGGLGQKVSSEQATDIGAALNRFGASLAQRDASYEAVMNTLAASISQSEASHQLMADMITQLYEGMVESLGYLTNSTQIRLAEQGASFAASTQGVTASLAYHENLHQQTIEAVAQISAAAGDSIGHLAVAVAATLAQFKKQIDQLSAKVAQLQAQEKASNKK
jgi:hypothetical protein